MPGSFSINFSAPAMAQGIDPVRYSLFLGLGLAITAVPILGRILRQYGLTHTEIGVVAISAAAPPCIHELRKAILGTLMNTRALMELIVLNIGFDLKLIPQKVFTMLVIMAVLTTLMAGPLLKRLLSKNGHPIPVGVEA